MQKPGKKSSMKLSEFSRQTTLLDRVQYADPMDTITNPKYYMSKPSCRVKEESTKTAHGIACCVAEPNQASITPGTRKKR